MGTPARGARELVRDARAAVQEARSRFHLSRAWELLQERDADGNPRGALPYSEPALRELAAAYRLLPDDAGVAHHLAIAHHARAWDLELKDQPGAAGEWELALGYWRSVAASGEFWAGLEARLRAGDPQAEASVLAEARRDLLEDLLDIHVDFVRHYCEGQHPERSTAHVEIVRRARLPPAVKKRLIGKVFDAMTGTVPEAKAAQAYDPALTIVERFLDLFPDHLPALRMHAELSHAWLSGVSYKERWDDVQRLSGRAEPYAARLAGHPELGAQPLARTALEDLCCEFGKKGRDKGNSYGVADDTRPISGPDRDAGMAALAFGMKWTRLAYPGSPQGASVRAAFGNCANLRALSTFNEVHEVMQSEVDSRTKTATMLGLLLRAIPEMEEAVANEPEDRALNHNLRLLREQAGKLEKIRVEMGW